MLADTPRVLITTEPHAHGASSPDGGRDANNCNISLARLAGSQPLMALPSTATSNKYAVHH
eukprot:3789103-Lingulodinium_polyedra.AAC.1